MPQGDVLHHPRVKNGLEKGCRETIPDGDSGRQEGTERGGRMGTVFWGQSWRPHCTGSWWGSYLFLHVSFLLHSSCFTYIKSRFAFKEWDFWEVRNDKRGLCFAGGFPSRPLLRCLPRLPAPASHPTEPGAKREKNTRRTQFTNRNKRLFGRFYIITKQNQGRKKKTTTRST